MVAGKADEKLCDTGDGVIGGVVRTTALIASLTLVLAGCSGWHEQAGVGECAKQIDVNDMSVNMAEVDCSSPEAVYRVSSREKRSPKSTPRSSSSRLTGRRASASTSLPRSIREVRNTSGALPERMSRSPVSWSGQVTSLTLRVVEEALKASTTLRIASASSWVP